MKLQEANKHLFEAAKTGDVVAATTALATGADPTAKDDRQYTPLDWAAVQGHADLVKVLRNAGKDQHGHVGRVANRRNNEKPQISIGPCKETMMSELSLQDVKTLAKDILTIKLTPEQKTACEAVLRAAKWSIGPKEVDCGMLESPRTAPRFNSIVTDDPCVAVLWESGILNSGALGIPVKEGSLAAAIQQHYPTGIVVTQRLAIDYLTKGLGITVKGATITSDANREIC